MMKHLALAAAFSLAAAGMAQAGDAPKSAEDCFKMSGDLFEKATNVPDDKKDSLENMFQKLEGHCDAGQFAEAAAAASEIKASIGN